MHRNLLYILIIIVGLLSLVQTCDTFKNYKKLKDQVGIIESLSDSIVSWKDKDGRLRSKISVIQAESADQLLKLKSSDSTVRELQKIVKESKRKLKLATTIKSNVKFDTILVYKDTIRFKDPWIDFSLNRFKDSLKLKFRAKTNISLVHKWERKNIFSKKYLVVEAIHDNKYLEVNDIKSLHIPVRKSKLVMGPMVGLNHNFQLTVGFGLMYPLVSF